MQTAFNKYMWQYFSAQKKIQWLDCREPNFSIEKFWKKWLKNARIRALQYYRETEKMVPFDRLDDQIHSALSHWKEDGVHVIPLDML